MNQKTALLNYKQILFQEEFHRKLDVELILSRSGEFPNNRFCIMVIPECTDSFQSLKEFLLIMPSPCAYIINNNGKSLRYLDLQGVDFASTEFRTEFKAFLNAMQGNTFSFDEPQTELADPGSVSLGYYSDELSQSSAVWDEETAAALVAMDGLNLVDDYSHVVSNEEGIHDKSAVSKTTTPKPEVEQLSNDIIEFIEEFKKSPEQALIQFRLIDGSSFTDRFSYTTTLGEVKGFLVHKLNLQGICYSEFHLASPMNRIAARIPEKFFEDEDLRKTIQELNLTPRAVLLIVPVATERNIIMTAVAKMSSLFWYLAFPIIDCMRHLKSYFFGEGNGNGGQSVGSHSGSQPPSPPPDSDSRHNRFPRNRSTRNNYTSGSNIHTLYTPNNDDDMNTYNGNSTQQMQ